MNAEEVHGYLANVLAVARSDGVLSPQEETAIEDVRNEIGAKKKDLKDAQKLAQREDFQPTPVGRYSERIRNLEDMVFMSLVDGEFDSLEKQTILAFAKQLGITQAQVNRIMSESKTRSKSKQAQTQCSSCAASVATTAKFCPECGASIATTPAPQGTKIAFDYPNQGIAIEFCESTAASFDNALRVATESPGLQECERSRKRWFLASWPSSDVAAAMALAEQLKGIRNRKVYVDGTEVAWNEVFGFLWCLQQRQSAYAPVMYCFGADEKQPNLCGCKQAQMEWTAGAKWLSYGHFRRNDRFVFDKARIEHELQTNVHEFRFCPHMRRSLMEAIVELLPAEVAVSERHAWRYKEAYDQTPNSIKVVEKEKEDGYTYKREFYADGVAPVGFEVGHEILRMALRKCGITDVDARSVFS